MKKAQHKKTIGHEAWLAADLPFDKVVAASYWPDQEHWVFDPWASREGAQNLHMHCHTKWARSIVHNKRQGLLKNPARFDWSGKTIYIVGRGKSLQENAKALNRRSDSEIAIFLNHSFKCAGVEYKPQDFVCAMDAAVQHTVSADDANGKSLIACVSMCPEVLKYPWRSVYGFSLWPSAPLNDLMRKEFPHLPEVNECLGIALSALHLASLNGAKRIILVGQDYTSDDGKFGIKTPDGTVHADEYYMQLAQAIGLMAYFAFKRTGAEVVNCSRDRLAGFNILNPDLGYMPWVKFDTLDNVVSGGKG